MTHSKKESFTLIEILVVVIVMAILAAIAIPIYQNSVTRAEMNISAANLVAEFEKLKIDSMRSTSYLYPPSHNMFCKNNGNRLGCVKELLSDVFCIKAAYASTPDDNRSVTGGGDSNTDGRRTKYRSRIGKEYEIKTNPDISGMTREQIMEKTSLQDAPIVAESYDDNPFNGKLASVARPHLYRGNRTGMFVRRDGRVYTVYSDGQDIVEEWR